MIYNYKHFSECLYKGTPGCMRPRNFRECSCVALQPPKRVLVLCTFGRLQGICKKRVLSCDFQSVQRPDMSPKMTWCVTYYDMHVVDFHH